MKGEINFGHGVRPHQPVLDPAHGLLYVTTELDDAITVIDPKSLKIVRQDSDGGRRSRTCWCCRTTAGPGYTANVGPGTVSVLDMMGRKTLAVIPVAGEVQRIAISRDDRLVFTSDQTQTTAGGDRYGGEAGEDVGGSAGHGIRSGRRPRMESGCWSRFPRRMKWP